MKNFCILHILLFLLLMLVYQCAGAQDYVVTSRGDTIRGEVKPLSYGLDKKVQVTAAGKKKVVFPILQTQGYYYKGEMYHPVRMDKGYTYMKLIKSGYLSLTEKSSRMGVLVEAHGPPGGEGMLPPIQMPAPKESS